LQRASPKDHWIFFDSAPSLIFAFPQARPRSHVRSPFGSGLFRISLQILASQAFRPALSLSVSSSAARGAARTPRHRSLPVSNTPERTALTHSADQDITALQVACQILPLNLVMWAVRRQSV